MTTAPIESRPAAIAVRKTLSDKQSEPDHRELPIDKVGVRGLRFPVQIRDKGSESLQNTVATIGLFVDLPKEFKGTEGSQTKNGATKREPQQRMAHPQPDTQGCETRGGSHTQGGQVKESKNLRIAIPGAKRGKTKTDHKRMVYAKARGPKTGTPEANESEEPHCPKYAKP